jgi:hypothetical protein
MVFYAAALLRPLRREARGTTGSTRKSSHA